MTEIVTPVDAIRRALELAEMGEDGIGYLTEWSEGGDLSSFADEAIQTQREHGREVTNLSVAALRASAGLPSNGELAALAAAIEQRLDERADREDDARAEREAEVGFDPFNP